jgi:hypothetical protein
MLELKIKLKSEDGERTFEMKEVVYEVIELNSVDNADLMPFIEKAQRQFGEPSDEVLVTIKLSA